MAALGRAVFWRAAGVATVLFPKMALRQAEGSSGTPIIVFSSVLVLVGGTYASIVLGLLVRLDHSIRYPVNSNPKLVKGDRKLPAARAIYIG